MSKVTVQFSFKNFPSKPHVVEEVIIVPRRKDYIVLPDNTCWKVSRVMIRTVKEMKYPLKEYNGHTLIEYQPMIQVELSEQIF